MSYWPPDKGFLAVIKQVQFVVLCDKVETTELGHTDAITAVVILKKALYEKI